MTSAALSMAKVSLTSGAAPAALLLRWRSDARSRSCASFDDYWAPCAGKDGALAKYVAALGPPDQARLRDAVRLAYLDGEPDGPRSYAAVA